jgi:hypothetical protein
LLIAIEQRAAASFPRVAGFEKSATADIDHAHSGAGVSQKKQLVFGTR